MRLVAESPTDWDVASRRALAECDSLERRRVPRTFWGSNEPRADAVAPWRAMRPHLIQMGVWCASAIDVQPRERKTGCAWTDNRECSDASTRRRFRTPLDKGPVNGWPLFVTAMTVHGRPQPCQALRVTRPTGLDCSRTSGLWCGAKAAAPDGFCWLTPVCFPALDWCSDIRRVSSATV